MGHIGAHHLDLFRLKFTKVLWRCMVVCLVKGEGFALYAAGLAGPLGDEVADSFRDAAFDRA